MVEFGGAFASCTMCSVTVEGLAGVVDSDDTDDAEGGGVVGKGLREFTAADLHRLTLRLVIINEEKELHLYNVPKELSVCR